MEFKSIQPGKKVRLIIGGPEMIVDFTEKSNRGNMCFCQWFDKDDILHKDYFAVETLTDKELS